MDTVELLEKRFLAAKIHRQRVPEYAVDRPALLARLDAFPEHGVIVMTAPAGYGKTTLVSQWAEYLPEPVAWLSLDEGDRDLRTFAGYVLAAVNQVNPEIGAETQVLLLSLQTVPAGYIADLVISDLDELDAPMTLVIDDYHLIERSEAAALVDRLIQHLPRYLRLVVISRSRPTLALAKLRLNKSLGEISTQELAFADEEAMVLVSRLAGRSVSKSTISALERQTEGWVTALSLAGLTLRADGEAELDQALAADSREAIVEFLIADVANRVGPELLDFLLKTAVVESFTAELCAALMPVYQSSALGPIATARAMIERIQQANLFLVSLDDDREWYRYHHLFRESLLRLLEQKLPAEQIARLHLRASEWYEKQWQISVAIRHALAAGDERLAARIAERHFYQSLDTPRPKRAVAWLDLLPESVMDRPGILMMRAMREQFTFRMSAAAELAREAERRVDREDHDLTEDEVAALRAMTRMMDAQAAQFAGNPVSRSLAIEALELAAPNLHFVRNVTELYVVLGTQLGGEPEAALRYAEKRLGEAADRDAALSARLWLAICGTHMFEGNLDALRATASTFRHVAEQSGDYLHLGWAYAMLGVAAYEQNDLNSAEEYFGEAVQLRHQTNSKAGSDAFVGLALTQLAQGRVDDAQVTAQRLAGYLDETGSIGLRSLHEALTNQILLTRNAFAPVVFPCPRPYEPPQIINNKQCFLLIPQLTAARSRLCQGTPEALAIAQKCVERVRDTVTASNEHRRLVEINTLGALVAEAQGNRPAALQQMAAAVTQGATGGFVRSIVDAGPAVVPLLSELRAQGVQADYIEHLLEVLADPTARRGPSLAKLLTNREMEVLEYLAARKSNKEIAAQLFLSPLTVKRHTQSLFRKLGASNRREAVVLAREKGLPI